MKKMFSLSLFVIALFVINVAAASAEGVFTSLATAPNGVIVPLGHGVDH